jgi:serine/threonine-protein kinase
LVLSAGTRLGSYEVTAWIGAGGMGEVYLATDAALSRQVALKVLPAEFAQDADRLARFEREAKTLAALNHPNIAAIYGLEKSHGTYALVMELVEGTTLSDRMSLGAMPLEEALPVAKQIAEGLEVAHERGIVHRDLKPANVKIRTDGTVKVLDFGLAKAMESQGASPGRSQSATITTPAMTNAGVILGTAAYMSPEQARGTTVDKRADIWAFGVVLFEMLSGQRLFDETTVSDTLAGVLKSDLRLEGLPASTPGAVRQLIARCLTRDLRRRLRDIGEARIAIEDAIAHPAGATPRDLVSKAPSASPRWWRGLPWAIAAAALMLAAAAIWAPWRSLPAAGSVIRLPMGVGPDMTMGSGPASVLLSPEGKRLVLVGSSGPGLRTRLYLRRLDELQASPLPGTEGARDPFFSPDGQWIGFFADGKLKKLPVNGGVALTLCDAQDDRGGTWGEDGSIAFTPKSGESPLFRVSSDGGVPAPLTMLGAGEVTHRWPQLLPGGRAVLYTANAATGNYEQANIVVQSLGGGPAKVVHRGGYYARYLSTGHLAYISQGKLFAAPFDLAALNLTTQPLPVIAGVMSNPVTGGAQFTFSNDGSFAYAPSADGAANPSIYWLDPNGRTEPLRATAAEYRNLRFSPDGERLALAIAAQQLDIWVYEWRRDVLSRLTSHPSLDADPVWTPDGKRIAFRSTRDGTDNIYWQHSDGSGEPQRLSETKIGQWPMSWHPGGRLLAFTEIGRESGRDVWILPIDGDETAGWKPGKPTMLVAGPSNEDEPAFSPDGRWLAFQSDESGRNEVYVRAFQGSGARTPVSTGGGLTPRWSHRGQKLFYRTADGKIMVATFSVAGDSFRTDKPSVWSEGPVSAFDVHPDGQRLAVLKAPDSQRSSTSGPLVFIFNFAQELRRVAPPSR